MVKITQDDAQCAHVASILKALGHPLRLRIVAHLDEQELHVGALAEALDVAQAAVSQQLSILRMKHLVERSHRDGRAYYRLAEPRLHQLLSCMQDCKVR